MRLPFGLAVNDDVLPWIKDIILWGLQSYGGGLRHWGDIRRRMFHTHVSTEFNVRDTLYKRGNELFKQQACLAKRVRQDLWSKQSHKQQSLSWVDDLPLFNFKITLQATLQSQARCSVELCDWAKRQTNEQKRKKTLHAHCYPRHTKRKSIHSKGKNCTQQAKSIF